MVKRINQVEVPALSQPWLRTVVVASLISFVCIFCAFWSWIPYWKDFNRSEGMLCIFPFWLPYLFVLVRLYEGRVLSGLVLAGTMGWTLLAPGVLLIHFVIEWQRNWWIEMNLAVALLAQPVAAVAAVESLGYMQIARRDWFRISGSFVCGIYGLVLLAIFGLAYAPEPRNIIDNESDAEHWLIGITRRNEWKYMGKEFYASLLQDSAKHTEETKCESDDPFWPLKPASHGYNFEYRAVVSETSARGCRLDTSFIITARPVAYRKTGIRSFLINRARSDKWSKNRYIRVHFTSDDRPATLSDPAYEIDLYEHRYNPQ